MKLNFAYQQFYFIFVYLLCFTFCQKVNKIQTATPVPPKIEFRPSENNKAQQHQKIQSDFIQSDNQFGLKKAASHRFYVWRAPLPSIGKPWPHPDQFKQNTNKLIKFSRNISNLSIFVNGKSADVYNTIIQTTVQRFIERLNEMKGMIHLSEEDFNNILVVASSSSSSSSHQEAAASTVNSLKTVESIFVTIKSITSDEPWPSLIMKESYRLKINENGTITVEADEVWGFIWAMETLIQCLFLSPEKEIHAFETNVFDRPRFPYRGLMIDTARHFIPLHQLLQNIDAMVMNKFNVFHWHMVDDQSFPFGSKKFPEMARDGAFTKERIYTLEDVSAVIQYARLRGIRVIPEFDAPAHTLSWGKSHNILTECYDFGRTSGYYGPLDPTLKETYQILNGLYEDIVNTFVDDYIHIGGDEVDPSCWQNNPQIQTFLSKLNPLNNKDLLQIFFSQLQEIIVNVTKKLSKQRKKLMIWQEAMEKEIPFPEDTIVQVWARNLDFVIENAKKGHKMIYSTCYYLDRMKYGPQWLDYYRCDMEMNYPLEEGEVHESWKKNILGGEACMWNEYQDHHTMLSHVWPLASAVAEKLWSRNYQPPTYSEPASRLEEHRCRMISEGIPVAMASGPAECLLHFIGNKTLAEKIYILPLISSPGINRGESAIFKPIHIFLFILLVSLCACFIYQKREYVSSFIPKKPLTAFKIVLLMSIFPTIIYFFYFSIYTTKLSLTSSP